MITYSEWHRIQWDNAKTIHCQQPFIGKDSWVQVIPEITNKKPDGCDVFTILSMWDGRGRLDIFLTQEEVLQLVKYLLDSYFSIEHKNKNF